MPGAIFKYLNSPQACLDGGSADAPLLCLYSDLVSPGNDAVLAHAKCTCCMMMLPAMAVYTVAQLSLVKDIRVIAYRLQGQL